MPLDVHSIPALLDAMSLAGFTLPMAAAALRAAIEADQRKEKSHVLEGQVQEPAVHSAGRPRETAEGAPGPAAARNAPAPAIARATPPAIVPIKIEPSPAWKRRREELRKRGLPANWRGRLDALTPAIAAVAPAIAPLSPIEIDPKILADVAPATPPPPGAYPLPEDWQPSSGRLRAAVLKGGEIGAANLVSKFCNHFHARAHEVRTAAGWQGRFSNWVIAEWPDGKELRLPLMRPQPMGEARPPPNDKWEALKRQVHGHAARRESG